MSQEDDLEERVYRLEQQVTELNRMMSEVLKQIPEIPERGMARFDAKTWESPSEEHATWMITKERAEKGPDGWATRGEVKNFVAEKENIPKTKAKALIGRLLKREIIEEHEDGERIRPDPDATEEQIAEATVGESNFDRAEERRQKAEQRGKRRDRKR